MKLHITIINPPLPQQINHQVLDMCLASDSPLLVRITLLNKLLWSWKLISLLNSQLGVTIKEKIGFEQYSFSVPEALWVSLITHNGKSKSRGFGVTKPTWPCNVNNTTHLLCIHKCSWCQYLEEVTSGKSRKEMFTYYKYVVLINYRIDPIMLFTLMYSRGT